ncbi:MAG: M23 family metallopeptidase [Candidatus Nitrotoga sp.]
MLDHSLKMNGSGPWWQYGKLSEDSGDGVIVTFDGKRFDGARKHNDETCVVGSVKTEQMGTAKITADLVNTSGCGDGYISYDEHPGYDYRASQGTSVKAVAEGWIIDLNGERCIKTNIKGTCNDWGYVGIDHCSGYVTQYGHLSDISVSAGAKVLQGETIGLSGNKAPATVHLGDHLHFEVLKLVGGVYCVLCRTAANDESEWL